MKRRWLTRKCPILCPILSPWRRNWRRIRRWKCRISRCWESGVTNSNICPSLRTCISSCSFTAIITAWRQRRTPRKTFSLSDLTSRSFSITEIPLDPRNCGRRSTLCEFSIPDSVISIVPKFCKQKYRWANWKASNV